MLSIAAATIVGSGTAHAGPTVAPGDRIDDFRLLDHAPVAPASYLSDMKAVVLIAQGNSRPVNTKLADIKNLRDKYAPQSVAFLMINSNVPESRDQVAAAAEKQGIDLPILIDETQLIGESLGLRNNGARRSSTRGTGRSPIAVTRRTPRRRLMRC